MALRYVEHSSLFPCFSFSRLDGEKLNCLQFLQLRVEEINILTTVFLKPNNEKVSYPNSVLATKPISNYSRSPDMADTVEFSIDYGTPAQAIELLKDRIKR